ncbi:MAG: hypothetical protein IPN34_12870 [Planctomycetes bacterium]|nr:hypothetical protein [Planctomycetota bacterium]
MNLGLFAGTVFRPDGRRAAGAYLRVRSVMTDAGFLGVRGLGHFREIEGYADARGRFLLSYAWSGPDFGEAAQNARVHFVAWIEKGGRNLASATGLANTQLAKNLTGMLGLNQFESTLDVASFGKDLIDAYRKLKSHPIVSLGMATTENWILLSTSDVYLSA